MRTDKRLRFFRRLALMTARPPRDDMRARKPCTRNRRRFFGWYVRFGIITNPRS